MGYGINPLESCVAFVNLKDLANTTMVWPHPEELFWGGSKMQCYETLRIASLSLDLSTPLYVTAEEEVHDATFLKLIEDGNFNGVLKRDYSMKGQHVIHSMTSDPVGKLKEALRVEKDTWKLVMEFFGRPKWFIQPFVAHLLYVGEVRCFFVCGRLVYKVSTTPGEEGPEGPWEVSADDVLRPLHTHA